MAKMTKKQQEDAEIVVMKQFGAEYRALMKRAKELQRKDREGTLTKEDAVELDGMFGPGGRFEDYTTRSFNYLTNLPSRASDESAPGKSTSRVRKSAGK